MNNIIQPEKNLVLFKDFLGTATGKRLFPNLHSGNWFIRTYSHDLIDAGVLVKLMGKFHVIEPDFLPTLITLLQEKTRGQSDGDSI